MRSLKTHSKISSTLFIVAFAAICISCGDEQKSEKIVVKVNETTLTKSMLDSALASSANKAKLREEFINEWIETEVLYQQAVKDGLLDDSEYLSLVNKSKKELAGILYIKKVLAENEQLPSDEEIEKYFNDNKEDFKLKEDLFKLNFLRSDSFEKAIQARNRILESGWEKSKDFYRSDSSLVFSTENLYRTEIFSAILLRVINALMPKEVSIILEIEPGKFTVVQLVEKYSAESVAPFEIEKLNAKNRLTILRQKEFIKEHIKKLVGEHNLEIERYTE